MRKSGKNLAVAGFAALSLIVAACGGSSDSDSAAEPTACETTTPVSLQLSG